MLIGISFELEFKSLNLRSWKARVCHTAPLATDPRRPPRSIVAVVVDIDGLFLNWVLSYGRSWPWRSAHRPVTPEHLPNISCAAANHAGFKFGTEDIAEVIASMCNAENSATRQRTALQVVGACKAERALRKHLWAQVACTSVCCAPLDTC